MSAKILNQICDLARDEDVFYMASGRLSQSILHSVVATTKDGVRDKSSNKAYSDSKIDNLVAVVIEMIQNVNKYRKEIKHYNNDLILITTNNNITVSTSNLTTEEDKENISKIIDFLNSLDSKEIRKYARETIKKMRNKDENSAGLGLIEVARLSPSDVKYNFSQYREDNNLFHFNMTVSL